MIVEHLKFEYQQKVLIEKMKISPPLKYAVSFQNSGCFIYFKDRGPKVLSPEDNVQLKNKEAVLLKCGSHFLELLKQTEDEQIEVIIIHLYPEVLKKLYVAELPKVIEKRNNKQSHVIASNDVIAKFIDSLEFYFQTPSLVNDDLLELKIKELVLLLLQSKNVNSILELVTDLYSTKTIYIREVVDLHLYSNLSLEELAKLCNLSLSSFKRGFKKEYNDSPNNYIITKKLRNNFV